MELTFRQACTAENTGEVEFLDVNHCVTIEDDFGFVTKDFVKHTAEGRQFINGNSHHMQTTFKSILLGEAIRLRRLNQRKDDYLSSLKRLKEKAICSKFLLNMTNVRYITNMTNTNTNVTNVRYVYVGCKEY